MTVSLRTTFVISLAVTIFLAVALTGWLSLHGSQSAVKDVAEDLCREMAVRIRDQVRNFIEGPVRLNQLNANALLTGQLDLTNPQVRQQYFHHQIQGFPTIAYTFVGLPTGEFYGARRKRDGELLIVQGNQTNIDGTEYHTASMGGVIDKFVKRYNGFDPRTRPWYAKANIMQTPVWSSLYQHFVIAEPAITAAHPVYDAQGELIGIFGVDIIITQISEFLNTFAQHSRHPGKIFIIERSGSLVASSTNTPVLIEQGSKHVSVSAIYHDDPLLYSAVKQLIQEYGSLRSFNKSHDDFKINVAGKSQFAHVMPIEEYFGLNWLIVIIVPELAFMENVRHFFWLTVASMTGIGLILIVFFTWLGMRLVIHPILRLNQSARAFAVGDWSRFSDFAQRDELGELGELAASLNMMATQLSETFNELSEKDQQNRLFIKELKTKNEELEQFNYMVSHDLKTPLITIRAFAGLLQVDIKQQNWSSVEKDVDHIKQASGKMYELLEDLLHLSHVSRIIDTPKPVDMNQVVAEACGIMQNGFSTPAVNIRVAPNLPMVSGDDGRLREVVQNLLENAIKFMGKQPKPRIEIEFTQNTDYAIFKIADNGVGIEKKYQKKIFEIFERLDIEGEGNGVGLALVKRIIEAHGGRVWVESSGIQQGSTFCFSVPLVKVAS